MSRAVAVPLKKSMDVPLVQPLVPKEKKPVPQQWEPQQREVLKFMIKNAVTFERIRREEIIPRDIPDLQRKIQNLQDHLVEVNRKEIKVITDF